MERGAGLYAGRRGFIYAVLDILLGTDPVPCMKGSA